MMAAFSLSRRASALILGACLGFGAQSASALCDFDGDGAADKVTVIRKRVLEVEFSSGGSEVHKLGKHYSSYICQDTDGDGRSEFVASRIGSRTPFYITPRRLSALSRVCRTTRDLDRKEVWKSRQSPHIPTYDPRKNSTALIGLAGATRPSSSCITAYDNDGDRVHSLGAYVPPGSLYAYRHYGGWGCGDKKSPSSVAAAAKKGAGNTNINVALRSNLCVKIPDPRSCYNSAGC